MVILYYLQLATPTSIAMDVILPTTKMNFKKHFEVVTPISITMNVILPTTKMNFKKYFGVVGEALFLLSKD